jgi:hypothetical protein
MRIPIAMSTAADWYIPEVSRTPHRLCVAPMMDWTDFIEEIAAQVPRVAHRI